MHANSCILRSVLCEWRPTNSDILANRINTAVHLSCFYSVLLVQVSCSVARWNWTPALHCASWNAQTLVAVHTDTLLRYRHNHTAHCSQYRACVERHLARSLHYCAHCAYTCTCCARAHACFPVGLIMHFKEQTQFAVRNLRVYFSVGKHAAIYSSLLLYFAFRDSSFSYCLVCACSWSTRVAFAAANLNSLLLTDIYYHWQLLIRFNRSFM